MKELEKYGKVEIVKNDAFVHVENSKLYDISETKTLINEFDEYNYDDLTDDYIQSVCVINRKYNFKYSYNDKAITYIIKDNEFFDATQISSLGKYNIIFDSCIFDGNLSIKNMNGNIKFKNCKFLYNEIYIHEPMIDIDINGSVIFEGNNITDEFPKIDSGLKIRCKKLKFKDSNTYFRALTDQIIDTKDLIIDNSIVEFDHDIDIHADKVRSNGFVIMHDRDSLFFLNKKEGEINNIIGPNIMIDNKAYDVYYNVFLDDCTSKMELYLTRQILLNQLRKLEDNVIEETEKEEYKLRKKYEKKVEKIKDNPVKKYIKKSK